MVLQSQLNRCFDRLFIVTHLEEHWDQALQMLSRAFLSSRAFSDQPEQLQRVLNTLFGEADVRGDLRVYCFSDGQSILSLVFTSRALAQRENKNWYAAYDILGKTKLARDRFVRWLRYRCEHMIATERHGNNTDVIGRVTSNV
jgi:hypothetical protein